MARFYNFKPEDVNALTMYQLQGYMNQMIKIMKIESGVTDDEEAASRPETNGELLQEARDLGLIVPDSMR